MITNLRLAPHNIVPAIWLPGRHARINPASPARTHARAHALTQMPETNVITNLQLAPHGIVRAIWPQAGSEAALGLDLLKGV